MRQYHQYCPIARAAEVVAEPWTPIILRNLLNGADTFGAQLAEAPGLSRSTLVRRLHDLHRSGVLEPVAAPSGPGKRYRLTEAGLALEAVLRTMGDWAEAHLGLDPASSDPGFLLHHWAGHCLAVDQLPDHRVLVRFDFTDLDDRHPHLWLIFDADQAEVCRIHPGGEEDLVVTAESVALAEWHTGAVEWGHLLRSGRLSVAGPTGLRRALPTWNRRSPWPPPDTTTAPAAR